MHKLITLIGIVLLTSCTDAREYQRMNSSDLYDYHARMHDSFMKYSDSMYDIYTKQISISWQQIFITQNNTQRLISGLPEVNTSTYEMLGSQYDSLERQIFYLKHTRDYYDKAADSITNLLNIN